jgi:hypothetical protein
MEENTNTIKLLDVVALLEAIPEQNLTKGEVGTIVEQFEKDNFEAEFSNEKGQTTNSILLNFKDLIVLHFKGAIAV